MSKKSIVRMSFFCCCRFWFFWKLYFMRANWVVMNGTWHTLINPTAGWLRASTLHKTFLYRFFNTRNNADYAIMNFVWQSFWWDLCPLTTVSEYHWKPFLNHYQCMHTNSTCTCGAQRWVGTHRFRGDRIGLYRNDSTTTTENSHCIF